MENTLKIQSKLNKFLKYDKKTGDFSLNPVLRFGEEEY